METGIYDGDFGALIENPDDAEFTEEELRNARIKVEIVRRYCELKLMELDEEMYDIIEEKKNWKPRALLSPLLNKFFKSRNVGRQTERRRPLGNM